MKCVKWLQNLYYNREVIVYCVMYCRLLPYLEKEEWEGRDKRRRWNSEKRTQMTIGLEEKMDKREEFKVNPETLVTWKFLHIGKQLAIYRYVNFKVTVFCKKKLSQFASVCQLWVIWFATWNMTRWQNLWKFHPSFQVLQESMTPLSWLEPPAYLHSISQLHIHVTEYPCSILHKIMSYKIERRQKGTNHTKNKNIYFALNILGFMPI